MDWGDRMKKKGICAVLLCIALGISGCSGQGNSGDQSRKESDAEGDLPQTETIAGLINEVGDIAVGAPGDTEYDLIVSDEEAENPADIGGSGTEDTESHAAQETLPTEGLELPGKDNTRDQEAAQTEALEESEAVLMQAMAQTETVVQKDTEKDTGSMTESEPEIKPGIMTESEIMTGAGIKVESETETEVGIRMRGETETEAGTKIGSETETEIETENETESGPVGAVVSEFIHAREAMGEHWSIAYEDLETGASYGYHEEDVLQSASVVKLFIMGAVYRYMCYPKEGERVIPFHEDYDGHLRATIESMIRVSDNDCANLLIDRLGEGDFALGAQRIKEFCEEYGYTGTSIGRRFLEQNPSGDNYTTAADTRKFLADLYHGTLVTEEASRKMLDIVMGQTRKNKIPAGLPSGFTSGNKTGEMPEGYGLGCIENDCAIVFPPEGMGKGYVLTIMSNDLGGRNSEAISVISRMSSGIAQWYIAEHTETETEAAAKAETE
jgi:beta-lactamase class A